ncbi:MAG: 3-hydroxyacyl-CoA dehydrogenase NAD-binding domain-containing protein [Bacteroidota bacterium]
MIKYKKDTDQIVTLTLDMDGRNYNIINHEVAEAFVPVIEHLKADKAKGQLKGVIITSAKRAFLAGGDLDYLYHNPNAEAIFAYSETLKQLYRDLESPGVPVVAAINGSALGSGFELALACHHRVVINRPNLRLGLPEVTIGIMPGNGGVIRLLWLLGIDAAYPVLTSGKRYTPKEALEARIIDSLAKDEEEMLEQARSWILQTKEGRRPWDEKDGRIPGGTARDPKVARVVQRLAASQARETYNNLPAPQAILSTLVEGSLVDFDTACRIESRYFTQLQLSPESRNMIKALWYDYNTIFNGEMRPKGYGKFRPRKVGIIGAGMMGSGIALDCLLHGQEVILKDVSASIAARGKEYIEKKLEEQIQVGRLEASQKEHLLKKVTTTETPQEFAECDLVIEAVFENAMVKTKVTKEAEAYMDEYALFASNTVSIPITELAGQSMRPENYVGLHFFAPVEEVPLVEIVRGEQTSDETIARAFDFVKSIRKTPIIVKDTWGFYVSRVQNTYILEGIQMLQEGHPPALIENLGLQAGLPKGALALADELGLELVQKYENQAALHYGSKYLQHPAVGVLDKMIGELKRPGRARHAGFYDYPPVAPVHQLCPDLGDHFPPTQKDYTREDLMERFLFVQVIEAVWCLQEKIIHSVPEANLGSIYGWGFPAFRGGVLQFIDSYGLQQFIERCNHYEQLHGPRFKVPRLLRQKAAQATTTDV